MGNRVTIDEQGHRSYHFEIAFPSTSPGCSPEIHGFSLGEKDIPPLRACLVKALADLDRLPRLGYDEPLGISVDNPGPGLSREEPEVVPKVKLTPRERRELADVILHFSTRAADAFRANDWRWMGSIPTYEDISDKLLSMCNEVLTRGTLREICGGRLRVNPVPARVDRIVVLDCLEIDLEGVAHKAVFQLKGKGKQS